MEMNVLNSNKVTYFMLMIIGMTLVGCGTASLNVKHIGKENIKNRSVYYALPKTQLLLTQYFKTTTTYYLKTDESKTPISLFCTSQLPTEQVGINILTKDEPSEIEIATRAIPDAQHVYAIELNAGYFENFDLTLDLTESGIIKSVDAKIVDQSDQIALSTATALIGALAGIAGPQPQLAPKFKDGEKRAVKPVEPSNTCVGIDKQARGYLKSLVEARQTLFLKPLTEIYENANIEVLANQYDSEIKKVAASLAKKSVSVNPVDKIVVLPNELDKSKETCLEIQIGSSQEYKVCASISDDLFSYKSTIEASEMKYESESNNGLRYRTPLSSTISIKKDGVVKAEKELDIAQYGPLTILPANLGNRTASYKLDLYDLTSSLRTLTISSAGSSPDKVAEALSGAIDDLVISSGQRDKEKLEKEVEILELLKKKQDAENALAQ